MKSLVAIGVLSIIFLVASAEKGGKYIKQKQKQKF
jgi:hypothetical protein